MDGWFFKTNLVCSPPSQNIDNGWMMMMMNDDNDNGHFYATDVKVV